MVFFYFLSSRASCNTQFLFRILSENLFRFMRKCINCYLPLPYALSICRECVRAGSAGSRTRRFLGHHLLHPLIWRLLLNVMNRQIDKFDEYCNFGSCFPIKKLLKFLPFYTGRNRTQLIWEKIEFNFRSIEFHIILIKKVIFEYFKLIQTNLKILKKEYQKNCL